MGGKNYISGDEGGWKRMKKLETGQNEGEGYRIE